MENEFKIDQLSVRIYKDKLQMGGAAADMAEKYISNAITQRGEAVIVLATGASQFEFLEALSQKQLDWKKVVAFHLDEYVGLKADHPASFRRYLRERIIDKVSIGKYYLIEGNSENVEAECYRIESLLVQCTVDVAFAGIGENGHLAFNDPPASFDDKVKFKVVDLDETSRRQQMGEGWFKTLEEIPRRAITMTIPGIMQSKAIICIVPEKRKAEAVKKTLTGDILPEFPASILRKHPKATLFLEYDSASLLDKSLIRT
jgi:glucosamine-6-phosphate deaminase